MTEHQKYLSLAFNKIDGIDYLFIETSEPDNSFQASNFQSEPEMDFVVSFDELTRNYNKYLKMIFDADIVIHGSAPDRLIIQRIKANKFTFRYCERFYKEGFPAIKYVRNFLASWLHHARFKRKNLYMLCSSAFTPVDCAKFGNYKEKTFKWGYFPKTEILDINKTVAEKKSGSIIWASRFIDWKHPETPVLIAERLKNDRIDFSMTLFGKGEMFEEIADLIKKKGLEKQVILNDTKNSDELRDIMKSSMIFLHTADKKEGWGAVINEAMNSGCAVVASHIVGSVPYLIKNGENGMIYENGNVDDIYFKVKSLLENPEKAAQIGINAYKTITEEWNADNTAKHFIKLSSAMLSGKKNLDLFENGPCSRAQIIKDNWYNTEWKY